MGAKATLLITAADVENATPGLYVTRATVPAYFPTLALVSAGYAELLGEIYEEDGARVITVRVTSRPSYDAAGGLGADEPMSRTITIGREFFVTALKDYNDWQIKWWREAIQNSVDAGATEIDVGARQAPDASSWTVWCDDNGSGMDEDTVVNKFLVLGATTKIGAGGAAGGFGKAKELLLLPWISWRIATRDVVVDGAGIDYKIQRVTPRVGTRLEVVMPADKTTHASAAMAFIEKSYLPHVKFRVNGAPKHAQLEGRQFVESVPGKCDIFYTPGADQEAKQPYLYVRARGLFMFERYIGDVPGYVVAELTAPSIDILTANRDGFRDWSVGHAIDQLGQRVAKDNMSALKAKQGLIRKKYEGTGKFRAEKMAAGLLNQVTHLNFDVVNTVDEATTQAVIDVVNHYAARDEAAARATALPSADSVAAMLDFKVTGPSHLEAALKQLVWEPDFFVMNEIEGWRVPKKFFPETMTPTVLKLAKTWVELCRFVMMQLGSTERFGVGWVFSESAGAMHVDEGEDEDKWLLVNPFRNPRYPSDLLRPTVDTDLKWLYAAAIHECTHMADGISYHDESFAAALTRNMAKCADGFRKIRAIVAGIRMRGGIEADD